MTGIGPPGGPQPPPATDPSSYNGLYWGFTPGFWKNLGKGNRVDLWEYPLECASGTEISRSLTLDAFFESADDYEVRKVRGNGRRSRITRESMGDVTLFDALSFRGWQHPRWGGPRYCFGPPRPACSTPASITRPEMPTARRTWCGH